MFNFFETVTEIRASNKQLPLTVSMSKLGGYVTSEYEKCYFMPGIYLTVYYTDFCL